MLCSNIESINRLLNAPGGPPLSGPTSVCIIGPKRTTNSILAMAYASRYAKEGSESASTEYPWTIYVSTGLSFASATSVLSRVNSTVSLEGPPKHGPQCHLVGVDIAELTTRLWSKKERTIVPLVLHLDVSSAGEPWGVVFR